MKTITYDETQWKLVPAVVTPEITAVYGNDSGAYQSAQELHTAMLAAAPEAPQPSQQAEPVYLVWLNKCLAWREANKSDFDAAAEKNRWMLYTAPPSEDARDAARYRTIEQERAEAEYQYITGAFDYETSPLGSREWCLYWAGWLARSTAAIRKGGA